jgi:hypothetical protein
MWSYPYGQKLGDMMLNDEVDACAIKPPEKVGT